MITYPVIVVETVSDSSESRLCELTLKRSTEIPESGMFSAEVSGVEYLPGKKMDVVVMYNPTHDEIFIRVTSDRRKIIGVASTLGSILEATASINSDTEIRITIEKGLETAS
jgi:hypothetical protein